MGRFNMKLALSSIPLLLLFLFIGSLRVDSRPLILDHVCALINCGQGACKPSNATSLGFDCECYPGWKKIQLGSMTYPSCVVPNCTLDLNCGSGSPPTLAPAPSLPPAINFSNPCGFTWCGDGTCESNGSGYICKCNEGSANLLNRTDLACFKQCNFGDDCFGLGIGYPPSPSPSSS